MELSVLITPHIISDSEEEPSMSKFKIVDLKNFSIDANVLTELPLPLIEKHTILPIKKEDNILIIATDTPEDFELKSMLETETGKPVKFVFSEHVDIKAAILSRLKIKNIFGSLEEPDYADYQTLHHISERRIIEPNVLSNLPDIPKIPDLVDLILYHGISNNASDIHIDPGPTCVYIRMRIDGVLHVFQQLPLTFLSPILSTIKVYAGMDIAETRLPQDGQISVTINHEDSDDANNPDVDVRVGSVATIYGEKLTLRILDSNKMELSLDKLGFSKNQFKQLDEMIKYPQGMILVTGPTGSGKTTTLFSILNAIKGFQIIF